MKNNFYYNVYRVVKLIPFGRVTSYGSIAKYIGHPQSSRMVGWALNSSHKNVEIPAHRVVNRVGLLTGKHHFKGVNLMQQLLENEGVKINNNQVENFENYFWDLSKNLSEFKS